LYLSNTDFQDVMRLTKANPQQNSYKWGEVELVDWVTFNGDSLQGLLYIPEDLNPDKKYPMLVIFMKDTATSYTDIIHLNQ